MAFLFNPANAPRDSGAADQSERERRGWHPRPRRSLRSTGVPLAYACVHVSYVWHVILTISASSATLVRRTFFPRHPARLGPRLGVLGSTGVLGSREKEREREREGKRERKREERWRRRRRRPRREVEPTEGPRRRRGYASGSLSAFGKRTASNDSGSGGGGDDGDGGHRERPCRKRRRLTSYSLLRPELFPASIRFPVGEETCAAPIALPTAPAGDASDGGGPKNRRPSRPSRGRRPKSEGSTRIYSGSIAKVWRLGASVPLGAAKGFLRF